MARGAETEAVAAARHALAAHAGDPSAHTRLGIALTRSGRYDEAISQFRAVLWLQPDHAPTYYNIGNAHLGARRPADAEASYRLALTLAPDHPGAHNNLGNALRAQGRLDEAVTCYERALTVEHDLPGTWNNLGDGLIALNRHDAAIAALNAAVRLQPDHPEACNNLGGALLTCGRAEEAVHWFARAAALNPDDCQPRLGEALALLTLGRFGEGWAAYEARWRDPRFAADAPDFAQPRWTGAQDVAGRTVLLWAEQGLGDTIQFARYAPLLERQGARVVLQVDRRLTGVLRHLATSVVAMGDPVPHFDLHSPLLSLPLVFATGMASIPAAIPYVTADSRRRDRWRAALAGNPRPRLGVAFSGNADLSDDALRSIRVDVLAPLLARTDIAVHVVQRDVRDADAEALARWPGVWRHDADLTDFAETAALLAEMDLLVSVDTSLVHLGGAMGMPVWVMLPVGADFRWLRHRDDSPWYPTARLFRQVRFGDWQDVVARVCGALSSRATRPGAPAFS